MVTAPYFKTVQTTAKGRWFGKKFSDIVGELGPGAKILGDPNTIIQNRTMIEYSVHMHEPPIPSCPVSVLHSDDDYVVINKPGGIPTHPTINYYYNSVTELLRAQFGPLFPCYRIDRLTSGVLILARSQGAARHFQVQPREKRYFARIRGRLTAPMVVEIPIFTFNAKRGFASFVKAKSQTKPSKTFVTPIKVLDDNTSIVKCDPMTGRTHQIRKHLALSGFPIANDPIYSSGTFKTLIDDPTEDNFDKYFAEYREKQTQKQSDETCIDCGARLYDPELLDALWLHCAEYTVGETIYTAPSPSWMEIDS